MEQSAGSRYPAPIAAHPKGYSAAAAPRLGCRHEYTQHVGDKTQTSVKLEDRAACVDLQLK